MPAGAAAARWDCPVAADAASAECDTSIPGQLFFIPMPHRAPQSWTQLPWRGPPARVFSPSEGLGASSESRFTHPRPGFRALSSRGTPAASVPRPPGAPASGPRLPWPSPSPGPVPQPRRRGAERGESAGLRGARGTAPSRPCPEGSHQGARLAPPNAAAGSAGRALVPGTEPPPRPPACFHRPSRTAATGASRTASGGVPSAHSPESRTRRRSRGPAG